MMFEGQELSCLVVVKKVTILFLAFHVKNGRIFSWKRGGGEEEEKEEEEKEEEKK